MNWVLDEIAPFRYILGDDVWFRTGESEIAAAWLRAFVARAEAATESAGKISATELNQLLATALPRIMTAEHARMFVGRWNRSLDYWAAGITSVSQVPAGQSTDFIALDEIAVLTEASNASFAKAEAQGYATPDQALSHARTELIQFMSEGDGGGVCAHVRLRLEQQAVMTRDAFDATLEIINDSATPLENIDIDVQVRRRSGEDVTELFAVRAPTLKDLSAVDGTGVIVPGATGQATWILVPTTDAAVNGPEEFLVSGSLRYRQDGLNINVPLAPATITVLPSPSLAVKYFHERQVFADDPFTVEIEPSIPYSLAVMVLNKGRGAARDVRIDSAQPKIVENEKGLLADFKIIATEVAGESLQPSLTVNFGQIDPGTSVIGRWLMTSTILGGFIEYAANFEHLDGLGNKKLSLVEGIEIHEMIHIVNAGEDARPDFLANDIQDLYDRPDTLHLSDGSVQPVSAIFEGHFDGTPTSSNLQVQLTANMPPGYAYLRLPDPGQGKYRLTRVTRANDLDLPADNFWSTDRTFLGNARRPIVENNIHLFDQNGSGVYTLHYVAIPAGEEVPPTSAVAQLPAESAARFTVNWSGEDNPGGRGISFFDVYVSVDNAPFMVWLEQTIDRSAIYQGSLGRTYAFYSVATDAAGNREETPLTADASTVVTRTNKAPTLELMADQVLREGETLVVQPMAFDADNDELTFSLLTNTQTATIGAVIHPYTGRITWATAEGSGPNSYNFTVQVLDNGAPRLGATRSFRVTVSDDNAPPVITPVASRSVNEGESITFTAAATDIDLPAQSLTFSLAPGAPGGSAIHAGSGLFTWTPSAQQGGLSYRIGIVAEDNGSPSMSSTQHFNVTVRDTRSDLSLLVGSTNVLAGAAISAPLVLSSGADLSTVEFELMADDTHLDTIDLVTTAPEITGSSLEFVSDGRFRVSMNFDTTVAQAGTREIARLNFTTKTNGQSSAASLQVSDFAALRQNGEAIANTVVQPGRLFVIEEEPILDTSVTGTNRVRLVLYGKPGTQCIIETRSSFGAEEDWVEATGLTMGTSWFTQNWLMESSQPRYFRVRRHN